jgi:hypothetical protein
MIPKPTGSPVDPLNQKGDIIELISIDPHINYYQQQLEEVFLPLHNQSKNATEEPSKPPEHTPPDPPNTYKSRRSGQKYEIFVTTDKQ